MGMTEQVGTTADVAELARRFTGAFNMRDFDALRAVIADDAQFRTRDGRTLRGADGARALLTAGEDANIRLEPTGEPEADDQGRVTMPVRVVTGPDAIRGTAVFEIRDGRIAAFEVVPDE
jgi:hypothetical protein